MAIANYEKIPNTWSWTTIGDVAATTSGGTPSRKRIDYYEHGSIPWIKSGELNDGIITSAQEHITEEALANSNAKVFPVGTTLVALYGATVGKTGILGIDAATNQAICAIFPESNAFSAKFMDFWLKFNRKNLIELSIGGAQPNISQGILNSFLLPLPPLPEQLRIVARIEALFSRLDAGVEALRRAKAQLQRYRQSVLQAAVEGRLTAKWREAHPEVEDAEELPRRITDSQKEIENNKQNYLDIFKEYYQFKIPNSWLLVKIADVGRVQLGRQRSPRHHFGEYMRPYLRVANVFENRIDISDILMMNFTPEEFKTYQLHYGDILLNEGQSVELIGRPAIYRDELPGSCFQNTLVRFSSFSGVNPEYSLCVFRSYFHNGMFQRIAKLTTTMAHLGAGRFSNLPFPLPPLLEQKEIISKISQLEFIAENTTCIIDYNLKRADRLHQSILKRAFQGKLVPQDPYDEPASLLLERIMAERIKEPHRRGRRRSPKTNQVSQIQ